MENHNIPNQEPMTTEELGELFQIRRNKLKELQENGKNPFAITSFPVTHYSQQIQDNFEEYEEKEVTLAGRMMTKRIMGKASFCHLQDKDGQIQLYVKKDIVGDEEYKAFKELDLGDIIGVTGLVFRTHKGEISVRIEKLTLLSKSLQILPEKFHGLKDTDIRYRQRYLDLIVNPEVKDTFRKRSEIIRTVRNILDEKQFLEVETPILMSIPSGAAAKPFNTHHNALDMPLHLRISLELPLKRLIVGGFDRVYEIGRVFRNEGISTRHNPEFTLLELYQAYTDYHGMMDLTEELFRETARRVLGTTVITYGDVEIDLGKPFARLSMKEAVKQYSGIDFDEIKSDEEARELAIKDHKIANTDVKSHLKKGEILNLFFEAYAEEHLVQPTFITDHPVEISPLAKKKMDDPAYTERFELFILTREHANAFSELNDPIDQKERFLYQESLRAAGDEEANRIDDDFITALEYGLPPTGGLGIGMDRMIMLLTNAQSIRDVLLFPTMKIKD
ncbi:lysine--tRNA ligase [Clostridiales bacterium COT073_COT-073]|nr:lysine--tRNA ligase [Clostridiales bacterium COT073_COT-073]